MCPRAGLDAVANRKISACADSSHSLYRLSYFAQTSLINKDQYNYYDSEFVENRCINSNVLVCVRFAKKASFI
jgi:hypothetical protein